MVAKKTVKKPTAKKESSKRAPKEWKPGPVPKDVENVSMAIEALRLLSIAGLTDVAVRVAKETGLDTQKQDLELYLRTAPAFEAAYDLPSE